MVEKWLFVFYLVWGGVDKQFVGPNSVFCQSLVPWDHQLAHLSVVVWMGAPRATTLQKTLMVEKWLFVFYLVGGVDDQHFGPNSVFCQPLAPWDHKLAHLNWVVWMGAPRATTLQKTLMVEKWLFVFYLVGGWMTSTSDRIRYSVNHWYTETIN